VRWIVLCVVVGLAAAVPAAGAIDRSGENASAYGDTTAEDPAAPDIVKVRVSNDDAGVLTFRADVPNRPALTDAMRVYVWIDTDLDAATGVGGLDYWLLVDPISYRDHDVHGLYCANSVCGAPPADRPPPSGTLAHTFADGPTIAVDSSYLGDTRRFRFYVVVIDGIAVSPGGGFDFTNYHSDRAPDEGMWVYDVRLGPGRLLAKSFSTQPVRPRSGRAFSARLRAVRADNGRAVTSGNVICKASVANRRVPLVRRAFARGEGVCTWSIPAGWEGKTIRGSISIASDGRKVTKTFARKVRA
jgi:hypothetical protein